jgi:hypothetical protein
MNNADRVQHYNAAGPGWELHCGSDDRIVGTIYIGNNYAKKNDYYGGYQGNYLKRIAALFPDKTSIAHLYAGQCDDSDLPGTRYDINPQDATTVYADARDISQYAVAAHDLWVCDPPYGEDRLAEYQRRYGCPAQSLNVRKVFREIYAASAVGAHIVWLDWQRPFYRGTEWRESGAILYRGSTGHKDRSISIYERQ